MKDVQPVVIVIDDDPSVREALQGLLETAAMAVELYVSPREYLQRKNIDAPACIILDVRLQDRVGLDFQRKLLAPGIAHRHLPHRSRRHRDGRPGHEGWRGGILDEALPRPSSVEAVLLAIENDKARRESDEVLAEIQQRLNLSLPRERQVMALVAAGQSSKQIAGNIGIGDVTARVHRRQVMRKMRAKSLAELARIAEMLKNRGVEV